MAVRQETLGESPRVSSLVTQLAHGFDRGDPVHFDGSNWVAAVAGDAGIGLVGSIQSRDTFEFVQSGFLDGLADLEPGQVYYVQADGTLDTTQTDSPIFKAYTATLGYMTVSYGTPVPDATTDEFAAIQQQLTILNSGVYLRLDGNPVIDVDDGAVVLDVDTDPVTQVFAE